MTTPPDTPKPPAELFIQLDGQDAPIDGGQYYANVYPYDVKNNAGVSVCNRYILAPSPQESHKLAEELERLLREWDRVEPGDPAGMCANDVFNFVEVNRRELLAALRSSPSEQADAKVWRDRATRAAHLLDEHSLTAPDHEDEAQRLICEIEDAAIAASGGAKGDGNG